ncbi:MAG: hypothetical protein A2W01_09745 [Candidatus Solincola sediminis]|nr:MAG: hypothetical protein A2W01_09745 [Candidatus Solincola sediminis]
MPCYNWGIMKYNLMSAQDRDDAAKQLGRELRGEVYLASRCPHARVEVIATSPLLDEKTPFPTLFWLTCPLLKYEVAKLENSDFRVRLKERLVSDSGFAEALEQAENRYNGEREHWAREMGKSEAGVYFEGRRGIGGTVSGGMKCLHAHLAHFLAGEANPIGADVAAAIRDCQVERCDGNCERFIKGARKS